MGDLRTQLRALLDSKDDQVHQAGMLGQRVLAQQMELQDRIMQLQEVIDVEGEDQAKDRFDELERQLGEWDEENAALSATFGPSKPPANGTDPVSFVSEASGSATDQRNKSSTSAAAQSRRAKNAAHRADDVEFAFEIGSGLLNEVRRLQSLLGERDKAIQDMKEEKDDLEASLESLKAALKTMEANADKYKEENWNLEVSLQDLRTSHTNLQASHTKLSSEAKVLTKQLSSSVASSEALTTHVSSLESQLEELKNKHETDLANARKHAASLARDKSDLQQSVDALKAEVAKGTRRFPKFGSPLTPNGDIAGSDVGGNDFLTPGDFRSEADPFSAPGTVNSRRGGRGFDDGEFEEDLATALGSDITPEGSPIKRSTLAGLAPNHPDNELEVLKTRLVLAQRQIGTLKTALLRERNNKGKGKRASVVDDDEEEVGELGEEDNTAQAVPRLPQFRVGGRGRGGGRGGRGVSLTERFRQVQSRAKGIPTNDDEELVDDFGDEELLEEQDNVQASPSPPNNRASVSSVTSVEGMDPAFANVLKRTPSINGSPSPLHHSVLARSARGRARGRGGIIVSDRPRSLVGTPEDLAAALGVEAVEETTVEAPQQPTVETAEFGCQTDEPELPPPSPPKQDMEIQTEADQRPLTQEAGTQSTPSKSRPALLVSTGTSPFHERQRTTTLTQQNVFALTPRTIPPPESDDEEDSEAETETGLETETDFDDYMDAQQSLAGASTPNLPNRIAQSSTSQFGSSVQDFHSVMTMSDVDASDYGDDDDDGESIKASLLSGKQEAGFLQASEDSPLPVKEYEDKSIGPDEPMVEEETPAPTPLPEPVVVVIPEVKKPEVKEMEIQTDPWLPTPPPVPFPATPPTPGSPTLIRVGGGGPPVPFTFIPTATAKTSLPTPSTTVFKETDTGFRQHSVSVGSNSSSVAEAANASSDADTSANLSSSTVKGLPPSPPPVDKTKPPTMMVPPPPRAPPPPGAMPPPAFVPERRLATDPGAPPPRPSSPPPVELIQRATTPTFGTVLSMSSSRRGFGGSMPPQGSTGIRNLPSTSSFRSAGLSQSLSVGPQNVGRKEMSTTSLTSDRSARSSISSDQNPYVMRAQQQLNSLGVAGQAGQAGHQHHHSSNRNVSGQTDMSGEGPSTDPAVIHAITQTMIGEFLYKYMRKAIGKGYGERRHKRFFWVHPYTRTLYWSSADPGSTGVSESSAKSAYIEGVRAVLDPNPMPPGLYQYSVIVSTPQREMKFTAPTKERHEIWMNALKYLLSRPNPANFTSPGQPVPESPRSVTDFEDDDHHRGLTASPQSQRSRARTREDVFNTTPRGQRSRSQISLRGGSIGKRSGTPAAEYLRWNGPESPYSPTKSFVDVHGGLDEDELDFELHPDSRSDEGYEGLENVRACCDGRHTVGGHHHHHHHHHHPIPGDLPDEPVSHPERPVSPSAWSFRSRTGSHTSHDGGNSLFSWGRGEDGKRRFGSKRSTKTVVSTAQAQQ